MKIAVAGTGYVGLSIATLLAQHNEVVAVDVIPDKVDLINNKKSPIQDDYIEPLGRAGAGVRHRHVSDELADQLRRHLQGRV